MTAQELGEFILKLIQGATPIIVAVLVLWQALSANKLKSQEVKLTEAEATIGKQGEQIKAAAEQQEKNTGHIETLNSELEKSQTALAAALEETARKQAALTLAIAAREQAERERERERERALTAERDRDSANALTAERDESLAQMKRQWEDLQTSILELKTAHDLEVQRITDEHELERSKRTAVEAENADLTLKNTNLGEQIQTIQEQLEDARKRISELEKGVKRGDTDRLNPDLVPAAAPGDTPPTDPKPIE